MKNHIKETVNLSISIVTPSFNQRDFIAKCLSSIEVQTTKPIEHIILDPGSIDGTREALLEYATRNPFVKLIFEPDDGQADAINRGFHNCTGDIVTWINTDDYYANPQVLRHVIEIFVNYPNIDFVYGRGVFVDSEGNLLREAFVRKTADEFRDYFINSVGILQPATFYRRSLLDRVGFLNKKLNCAFDYEFWVRFIMSGAKFYFLDENLAEATFHDAAKSSNLRSQQLHESLEVTKQHYGFCSAEWVQRTVECDVANQNGIHDAKAIATNALSTIETLTRVVFQKLNNTKRAKKAIFTAPQRPAFQKTKNLAISSGLINCSSVIVTTFDNHYLELGLTLIASIHRLQPKDTVILVYDLSLSKEARTQLESLYNVFVVDYPEDDVKSYPDFLSPKNYGYKCAAIWDARNYVRENGCVLWIDAGVCLVNNLEPIFDLIERDHVFFVDHDDKPSWPFFNASFTHPSALELMGANRDEMIGEHLCSCLLGYKTNGRFLHLFEDAAFFARNRDIVVHSKHLEPGSSNSINRVQAPIPSKLRSWTKNRSAYHQATKDEVERAFGYLGHRQDQSIFSLLAARYNAPIQSAKYYCPSNESSSIASKLNWESGGISDMYNISESIPESIHDSITYHHRGTFRSLDGLSYERYEQSTLVLVDADFINLNECHLDDNDIMVIMSNEYKQQVNIRPRYYLCLDSDSSALIADSIEDIVTNSAYQDFDLMILNKQTINQLPVNIQNCDKILDYDQLRLHFPILGTSPQESVCQAVLIAGLFGYPRLALFGLKGAANNDAWRQIASILSIKRIEALWVDENEDNDIFDSLPLSEMRADKRNLVSNKISDDMNNIMNINQQETSDLECIVKSKFRSVGEAEIYISNSAILSDGLYHLRPPAKEFWIACCHKNRISADQSLAIVLKLCVSNPCNIEITVCRDGETPFEEAFRKTYVLTKGEHSLQIKTSFKNAHRGLRVQLATTFGEALLNIDRLNSTLYMENSEQMSMEKNSQTPSFTYSNKPKSHVLVILGNGPSMKGFDFNRFNKFDAIGMNAAYRYWDQIGWYPRYYICLDKVVGLSHKDHIARLIYERQVNGIELFVLRQNLISLLPHGIAELDCILDFDSLRAAHDIFDPMPITTGSHSALFGAFLGYREMILMGIDCNYVEKVDGALEQEGTMLKLAETPKENPNYFFDSYQVAGDEYNIPNPTPNLHLDSWRAVAQELDLRGVRVSNGSEISLVDPFPKRKFSEIEREESIRQANAFLCSNLPSFERDAHAHFDETSLIRTLFDQKPEQDANICHTMIDVGAHFGTALSPFLEKGWNIFAFEPDEMNRAKLVERLERHKNKSLVSIDPRCISNKSQNGVSFYRSEQSTGISGLSAFHKSHVEAQQVDIITLTDFFKDQILPDIDFLKIDTEGHDLFVLQGFPWERGTPSIIECEFEDTKTVPLGYTFHDLANFLVDKGYSVYVSEWHPIVRYGIRHDWNRLLRYPCELADSNAWGNLLAFREPIDESQIILAVQKVLKCNRVIPQPEANKKDPASVQPLQKTIKNDSYKSNFKPKNILMNKLNYRWTLSSYAHFAEWVRDNHPTLFKAGQHIMRILRFLKQNAFATISIFGIFMLIIFQLLLPPLIVNSMSNWAVAVILTLGISAVGGAWLIRSRIRRVVSGEHTARQNLRADLISQLRETSKHLIAKLEKITEQQTLLSDKLESVIIQQKELSAKQDFIAASQILSGGDYQPFNRRLKKEHTDVFIRDWAKKLDLKISHRSLVYLAHRICVLEQLSKGRLATPIENAVLRVLVASAVKDKNLHVLEIGTLFGLGLTAIYDHCISRFDSVSLTAIDPLDGYYGTDVRDIVTDEAISEPIFRANLAIAGVPKNEYSLIKTLSTDASTIESTPKGFYDVFVIDGDHSYEGVKADYDNYLTCVKPGGYIIFDDYGTPEWPGVKDFVDASVHGNPDLIFIGASWRSAVFQVINQQANKQHGTVAQVDKATSEVVSFAEVLSTAEN